MLARRWPPGLRPPLAAMALLLFLCLAGSQPSVVRAVLMAAMALLIVRQVITAVLWGCCDDAQWHVAVAPGLGPVDWVSTQCSNPLLG